MLTYVVIYVLTYVLSYLLTTLPTYSSVQTWLTIVYTMMILSLIVKKAWAILLKPVIRQVLVMRSQSKGPGAVGGELPGGSF